MARASPNFPIVEAFGYPVARPSKGARRAKKELWCPFAETPCEKYRQYGYGYCSVSYAASDDGGMPQIYAVCDHRLDGDPIRRAVADHFPKGRDVRIAAEIVLSNPRTSFDFAAFTEDASGEIDDLIVIEAQAIDMRGGGVGPAWQAWMNDEPERWREYFTREAKTKGRKDSVAYGVNMANIYKRLGLQVAVKGSYLKALGVPLYVVMQDRPFQYLRRRIQFEPSKKAWDITFMTFDYTGELDPNGQLVFEPRQLVRSALTDYVSALTENTRLSTDERDRFLRSVKRKAGLADRRPADEGIDDPRS